MSKQCTVTLGIVSVMTILNYYLFIIPVPDDWATVDITNSTNQNALHNTNYILTCTVMVIDGMNLDPTMEWVGPNGFVVPVESGTNITVSNTSRNPCDDGWSASGSGSSGSGSGSGGCGSSSDFKSFLILSFDPVLSSDGGRYTCRAAISVPWMATQPPVISSSVDMHVTSKWRQSHTIYK